MEQGNAFQDLVPNNHCFGCGPENPLGLQIKSHWVDENKSACRFVPSPHHCAGPVQFLNGGIISTIIDCHCICTAIAKGYQLQEREIGTGETIWYVTGKLDVTFLKPVRIEQEVELVAEIDEIKGSKMTLTCQLYSAGELCCSSQVVAIQVPNSWLNNMTG
ncbi:PaaI family thioesterase [Vibrio proteolyticus]|uniref:Acyl-coenzyme A thioesterase THEM4 n=1 Tax=Vibrio proteolyticus NBRC 13287 TaxID=1219065 RepID=U2ZH65_VIBPR|nr:PaaI family thioesterase [Vibrio proteolyticus]GAD67031.1 hypothetical protein VPR01S_06_00480 [Vibrio proteolyticus NBRC 13287]